MLNKTHKSKSGKSKDKKKGFERKIRQETKKDKILMKRNFAI